jgi:preprotein translocase subunit SecE
MLKYWLMYNVVKYLREVRSELARVTWPKRTELTRLTMIVLVISGAVALYVGALDFLFTQILQKVITL